MSSFASHRKLAVPKLLHVGKHGFAQLPELLFRDGDPGQSLIVSGPGPSSKLADDAFADLTAAGLTGSRHVTQGGSVSESANLAAHCITTEVDLVVAVGGGRVIDTVKYAAARTRTPVMAVPTTLAHDGISSPVASLIDAHGVKRSLAAVMPAGVVVDTSVIARSPRRHLRAGLGDLVSNLLAIADWRLAEASANDTYDEFSALIAESAARPALDIEDLDDPAAIDVLAKGLVMSGLAMATAGTSRPCSGAEHLISHALDQNLGSRAALHGEQVALGSLIAGVAQQQYLPQIRELFTRTGLPSHPQDVGISCDELRHAVQLAPSMRPERHTILSTMELSTAVVDDLLAEAFL